MLKKTKKFLITGSAGFIGFHLAKSLLSKKYNVIGLDGFTNYYDINLKRDRSKILEKFHFFKNYEIMLEDIDAITNIFHQEKPNYVIHLAAQAGVRYSLENPRSYLDSNLIGTFNILEVTKKFNVEHLLIASTSSVYGSNEDIPFNENQKSDMPLSFYAATKKSNEVMAHSYSYSFKLPITAFRFFTVYGPWGRPDMALFKFTKLILSNKPIDVYNNGDMKRDFTYVDDLVKSIINLIPIIPNFNASKSRLISGDSLSKNAPYRIVNIGNSKTVDLMNFIHILEKVLNKKASIQFKSMQVGDVKETHSDTTLLKKLTNFKPNTEIEAGIQKFVKWYQEYYD